MLDAIADRFRAVAPACDFWSLRAVARRSRGVHVRQGVVQPVQESHDLGAMITVHAGGGVGYAATSDLGASGLAAAGARALVWAQRTAGSSLVRASDLPRPSGRAAWRAPAAAPWEAQPIGDLIAALTACCARLKRHERIVDWSAGLAASTSESLLTTSDGAAIAQTTRLIAPHLEATANRGGESQERSLGRDSARQGGLEQVAALGAWDQAERIADEAVQLLDAPDCPSGRMDLVLLPSQMTLQIHESIGHPLELDRILGDERNYAGTSFVTADMFGSYRYGSDLLTVTFDPGDASEVASYGFDDDGAPARRELLIERGILVRPLGGAASQARAGLPGTANARACDWNRPAIDRMANLNVEPGDDTLETLIAQVERGVLMDANRSWSIDDSRNKFQFGCEWARRIVDGRLAGVVRNPNYRGISATFWRSLAGVGDAASRRVHGTPNCGKGEPNQVIAVGHASPPCWFRDVEVFGGAG